MEESHHKWLFGVAVLIIVISLASDWYIRDEYQKNLLALDEKHTSELATLEAEHDVEVSTLNTIINDLKKETKDDLSILTSELQKTQEESSKELEKLAEELSDIELEAGIDFSAVVEDALEGVVAIQTDVGEGSGAIISDEGYIVTNYHVIDGASALSIVTHDGSVYSGGLIGSDTVNDLAVLKMSNPPSEVKELNFANSDNVKIGENVIALGNPAGLSFTVTEGIISQKDREVRPGMVKLLQTDAQINPGNSGGPLLNKEGNIIGILVLKVQDYEGLGFAIPSNYVKPKVEEIIGEDV